jgi:hypothetical protein
MKRGVPATGVVFCLLLLVISHVRAQPILADLTESEKNDEVAAYEEEEEPHSTDYKVGVKIIQGLFRVNVVIHDNSRIAQFLNSLGFSVANNKPFQSLALLTESLQEPTEIVRKNSVELKKVFESRIQELQVARRKLLSILWELEATRQDSTLIKQELRAVLEDLRSIKNSEWLLWSEAVKKLKDSSFQIVEGVDARMTASLHSNYKFIGSQPQMDRLLLISRLGSSRQANTTPRETSVTPNIFLANLWSLRLAFDYLSILLGSVITGLQSPAPFIVESVKQDNAYFFPDTSTRNVLRRQLLNIAPDFKKESKIQIDLHSILNTSTCCIMRILSPRTLNMNICSVIVHEMGHSLGVCTNFVPHSDRPYKFSSGAEVALYSICSLLEKDCDAIRVLCKAYYRPDTSPEDKDNIDFSVYESLNTSNAKKLMQMLKDRYPTTYANLDFDDIDPDRVQLSFIEQEHADYFIDNLDIQRTEGDLFEKSGTIKKDDDNSPFNALDFVKTDTPGLAQFIFDKFHNQCDEEQQQIQDLKQGFKVVSNAYTTPIEVRIYSAPEPNSFSEHLVDSFGKPSAPYMEIVQSDFNDPDKFTIMSGGHAFFQGDNVARVLQNSPLSISIGNRDLNPSRIVGVPILGFEGKNPELSHIELLNCLMSHQSFSNYDVFTKLELAVLKDLGYPIDLENFWGISIYGDDGTYILDEDDSFFARDQVVDQPEMYEYKIGTPNNTQLSVGLHVYGHGNTILLVRKASEVAAGYTILQSGDRSVGIRVDGWENTLRIVDGSRIISDGKNGVGVMVCYGKCHRICQVGTISAVGEGGIGACFSFGGSILGEAHRQKGSFINTKLDSSNRFLNFALGDELKGPLVEYYDLKGRLEGQKVAIYISKNTYVNTIGIGVGSEIRGDIFNEWNPLEPFVQHEARYTLHTKICFGARRDEDSGNFVTDSSYNGIFRGSIRDKCNALDVCLMGGTLNWGRGDSLQMSDLGRFHMCRGSRLCLLETHPLPLISAKELIFEPETTIVVPSRHCFQMSIAVPGNAEFDCDSVKRNVRFESCDPEERNPFCINCSVEEPNAIHPEIRIFNFFESIIP